MNEKIISEYNIPLGGGKYATIDLCDLDKIEGFTFSLKHDKRKGSVEYASGYLTNSRPPKTRQLHHLILGIPTEGLQCGHRDGNGLNCTRRNLRWLTPTQNQQGPCGKRRNASSPYRGVSWSKISKRWLAQITVEKRKIRIGSFDDEMLAAKAYDAAARKYFGEYAAPNFPL